MGFTTRAERWVPWGQPVPQCIKVARVPAVNWAAHELVTTVLGIAEVLQHWQSGLCVLHQARTLPAGGETGAAGVAATMAVPAAVAAATSTASAAQLEAGAVVALKIVPTASGCPRPLA